MQELIRSAQVILPCSPFDETLTFFTNRLGFQLDLISPADDPAIALLSGYGLNLRLERNISEMTQATSTIRLVLKNDSELFQNAITEMFAPNGTKIEIVKETTELVIPPIEQAFVVSKVATNATWVRGRAGMNYRDLIPGRLGGRFIASHIQIPTGGPVADYVHYHEIRFQMIYVYRGWVRLVYEDQGPPFVLQAGDCVLQPPLIRHRVLESSAGLEVIEVACPATHSTYIDHHMQLPNTEQRLDRDYKGQRFVKYLAADETAQWHPWRLSGFEFQDTGIGLATADLAGVRIVRNSGDLKSQVLQHNAEFVFIFVLAGELTLHVTGHASEKMTNGDAFVVPEKLSYNFSECSKNLQFLEVSLPGTVNFVCE
ncbi:unnamed protein product [Rotaria sp. Silwood1]|nr:unnamed protein product [Rotaria sp. Silwood1]CAF3633216.1 unnamed protein product [Rotaria sp. Silwood1]CAF3670329.1 unnamed protein product [Rotaria sp. Silwood1]CAF4679618.1 unnamed protein product [Rotaria sp. Silwood1]